MRHGDAECSPRCQGTGSKSVSWQGQNNISVKQGNNSLQDPVRAQSLQGFKTERINCWKKSSSGVTKHGEIQGWKCGWSPYDTYLPRFSIFVPNIGAAQCKAAEQCGLNQNGHT